MQTKVKNDFTMTTKNLKLYGLQFKHTGFCCSYVCVLFVLQLLKLRLDQEDKQLLLDRQYTKKESAEQLSHICLFIVVLSASVVWPRRLRGFSFFDWQANCEGGN
jgi:hypothetical protein